MDGFISPLAVIGQPPEHRDYRWKADEITFHTPDIHPTAIVEAYVTIDSGIHNATYVGAETLVMKHAHIGHDANIGEKCNIAPGALIGGHVTVGNRVKIGMGAMIRPRVSVGNGAIIGMGAVVVKNVPAGETWAGNPARPIDNFSVKWTPQEEYDAWMEWWESWNK